MLLLQIGGEIALEMSLDLLALRRLDPAQGGLHLLGQCSLALLGPAWEEALLGRLGRPLGATQRQERGATGQPRRPQRVAPHLRRNVDRRPRGRAQVVELLLDAPAGVLYFLPSFGCRLRHCSSNHARVSFAASIDCRGYNLPKRSPISSPEMAS